MEFWDYVEYLVNRDKTTYRWLAEKLEIPETTMSGWRRTKVLPRADHAYIIAKLFGSTVEQLVDGEDGNKYITKWAQENIETWAPPERLSLIVKYLARISDRDLRALEAMAKSYARDPEPDPNAERGIDFEDLAAAYGTWEQDDVRYIAKKPKPKKKKKDDEKAG